MVAFVCWCFRGIRGTAKVKRADIWLGEIFTWYSTGLVWRHMILITSLRVLLVPHYLFLPIISIAEFSQISRTQATIDTHDGNMVVGFQGYDSHLISCTWFHRDFCIRGLSQRGWSVHAENASRIPAHITNPKCVILEVICLELAARVFSESIPNDAGVSMIFVPFLELRRSTPVCIAVSIANVVRDILPSYCLVCDYRGGWDLWYLLDCGWLGCRFCWRDSEKGGRSRESRRYKAKK